MASNTNKHKPDSSNTAGGRRPPADKKEFLKRAGGPFGFLLLMIMICSFLAHYLNDSETLQEYADNHPELAYGDSPGTSEPSEAEEPLNPSAVPPPDETSGDEASASQTVDEPPAYNISEESLSDAADSTETDSLLSNGEDNDMAVNPERTTYQDGFYYEPLSETVKQRITGVSYPETGCTVPYEDLNYVGLLYVDFNGEVQEGELICNKAIAQDMVEIFYELYQNDYRIERIRLIDEYGGDDTLSMLDNNTSCFNYRVVDGTTSLSKHALGCAIDINPFYNPYVVFNRNGSGETYISPAGSEVYADRTRDFPYKIDENDLCYKLFIQHGFTWGGNWNSSKDYQHFQIVF